jgi:hypothetical protein
MTDRIGRYYVYYNGGSCTDQDHACGLESFDTAEEAFAFLKTIYYEARESAEIIYGAPIPCEWSKRNALEAK